jgi:shikimate dehydrogenase
VSQVVGVIGSPVAHSLSPVFQSAAFRACGLDVRYELWETPGESIPERLASLREAAVLGANVTVPHKEAVLPFLDELGGQSARVGAVNTIVNRGGRLFGFNTDGQGFVAALRNEANFDAAGKSILLAGAGGAARGIAFALADARCRRLAITNRSRDRAEQLAADIADAAPETEVSVEGPDPQLATYDCVVNCTSVGMHGGPAPDAQPVSLDTANERTLVADIVYAPEVTPLLRDAAARGLRTLGGLAMLIYQGALGFELWTGVPAPVDVMFDAAKKALAARAEAEQPP